jgi:hypothetical protein
MQVQEESRGILFSIRRSQTRLVHTSLAVIFLVGLLGIAATHARLPLGYFPDGKGIEAETSSRECCL